jgi:transposase
MAKDVEEIDITKPTKYHRLDTSDPALGEVHGERPMGVFYIDGNGFPFSQSGTLVVEAMTSDQKAELRKKIARDQAGERARKIVAEQLSAQGFSDADVQEMTKINFQTDIEKIGQKSQPQADATTGQQQSGRRDDKSKELDLAGWAKGRVDYPFDQVRNFIREKFGISTTKSVDALSWAQKQFNIPESEMRTGM